MTNWTWRTIKQVAEVRLGKMVQPNQVNDTDIEAQYLRAAHIQPEGRLIEVDDKAMWFGPSELRGLDLLAGDVVVVEGGAGFGRSAYLQESLDGWGFQNSIVRVRPKPTLSDGRFLNYVFQTLLSSGRTELEASVATIPHYTAEKVASTRHPMPPVEIQTAIADFLDRETAQIDAMIEAQEALLQELGLRRTAAVVAEVGLGEDAAQGWESIPFKYAISTRFTGEWGSDPGVDEEDVLCLRVADFDRVRRRAGAAIPTTRSIPAGKKRAKGLRNGDLLVERSGGTEKNPVGNVMLYDGPDGAVSSNFIECVRLTEGHDPAFWCYLQEAAYSTGFTSQHVRQTSGIQNLDAAGFYRERFNVPPYREQRDIVRRLDEQTHTIAKMFEAAEAVVALLRERREALISAAVTGRIDPHTGIERLEDAS